MKIRIGFISNSSSSSFIVDKIYLTPEQIQRICNYSTDPLVLKNSIPYCEAADACTDLVRESEGYGWNDEGWLIDESSGMLRGSCMMDNFDIVQFMIDIGVPADKIHTDY